MTATILGGRYRVTGALGAGGQGEVLSAEDTWCANSQVVLKRVLQTARESLRAEFSALRSLVHPALVEARDFGVFAGECYLVEAFVSGVELAVWAQGRSAREVALALAPVAHALAHLHARGLVHMDPSPANILMADASAVLLDLGLVRPMGVAGAAGTVGFVAPEVLAGESVAAAADVYGLAATMAFVLGGSAPQSHRLFELSKIEDGEVRRILADCLSHSPASRPTALELSRQLTELGGANRAPWARPLMQLPLCGREGEASDFERWLSEGTGAFVIGGNSGSGRTAFADACADRARISGFAVLAVSADDPRALERLVGQAMAVAAASSIGFGDLNAALGDFVRHTLLSADAQRVRTATENAELAVLALDTLGRATPTLVVVDETAAADEALTRAIAIWRARRVDVGSRFLLVVDSLADVNVEMTPLSESAVRQLLHLSFAEERPTAEAEHLLNVFGGTPRLLLGALQRLGRDGGRLLDLDAGTSEVVIELPPGLAPLALTREAVPEAVVRELIGDDIYATLQLALHSGALRLQRTGDGASYLVPESVRLPLLRLAKASDHAMLATAFESANLHLNAASSWAQAGDLSRAIRLLQSTVGARADERLRAISGVAAHSEDLPQKLVEEWARLASAAANVEAMGAAAAMLKRLGQAKQGRRLMAACQVKLGRYREALATLDGCELDDEGRAVKARALLFCGKAKEAMQIASTWREANVEARADMLDVLGHSAFATGDVEAAKAALGEALAQAEAVGDPIARARAQNGLGIVMQRTGEYEQALELYRAALRNAGTLGRVTRTANLATLFQDMGMMVDAREQYTQALSEAVALANVREQVRVGVNLANLMVLLGELGSAIQLAQQTLQLSVADGSDHAAVMACLVLCEARLERQDHQAAGESLEKAVELIGGVEDRVARAELDLLRVRWHVARGELELAAAHLGQVDVAAGAAHLARQIAFWRSYICLASGQPNPEQARQAYELAVRAKDDELRWRAAALWCRACDRTGDEYGPECRVLAQGALDAWLDRLPPNLQTSYLACASRKELAQWVRSVAMPVSQVGPVAYRRILGINRRLAREHEVGPLLELIVDAAIELLGAERGFVVLRDGDGVRVAVARQFDKRSLEDGRQRISRSIALESLRTGEAILTTNAQQDDRFANIASVAMLKVRSVVCVPLRGMAREDDPVIGALYLDHRFQERAFTDDDVEFCESFADQAAIALENARLLERTREQERRLAAQNERLERLNKQLQNEAAQYAAEAEDALRRLREEGPTVGVGKGFERMVGRSDKLREALRMVDRFADTDVPVVIFGESGTGKELIARAIHERSSRANKPFVSINCGAIPENLIESELFGYKRGAFTGAVRDKAGLLAAANHGTLLLDEIGEMPLTMQVKMLRVLQEREYRPVGATESVPANVRVVSASHENLEEMVANGRFREDLFYRLRVVEICVPPLRERREDIPALVDHFCRQVGGKTGEECFSNAALARLLGYDWPGNVRELENEVRRALALSDDVVDLGGLSERFQTIRAAGAATLADTARGSLKDIVEGFECQVLLATLGRNGWNVRQAAKDLGLSRAAFYTRLSKYGITREGHSLPTVGR